MHNKIIKDFSPGMTFALSLLIFLLANNTFGQSQETFQLKWNQLMEGCWLYDYEAPEKSFLNDSRLTILKIDPKYYQFQLLSATEHGKKSRTAQEWADEFGMSVIVNAGMYNLANGRTNMGYMKNYAHYNNPRLNKSYNVMMAMNPKDQSEPSFKLFDLASGRWDSIRPRFNTFSQGMRMIDHLGNPLSWNKRPWQTCSMILCATDIEGIIYFVFTRSPYTHQKMIDFLLRLPVNIRTTVYLEGGPEASLYINTGDTLITKFGSYVAKTYENDDNDHFWKIPNVIGIKSKK